MTTNPEQRKRAHKSSSNNPNSPEYEKHFYRAIRKHGWENFEYNILFESNSISCLKKMEREYIQKFDSVKNGYNITLGGEGRQWTEEQKQQMSIDSQFKNSSLDYKDLVYIREAYLKGKKPSEIYPEFEDIITNYYSFMNIWAGNRYGYVMPEVFEKRPDRVKLDYEKATEIRELYKKGDTSYQKLADLYNVGKCTIRDVVKNVTWKIK